MLTFEEFYEKRKMDLVEFWGKLIAEPISAEEFAYCVAKQCFKQYNKGAEDALNEVRDKSRSYQKTEYCLDCCSISEAIEDTEEEIDEDFEDRECEDVDF